MSKQRVNHIELYESFFIPGGVGQIEKTMPPSKKTLPNLKMFILDNGQALIEWGNNPNNPTRCLIGAASVKVAILMSEAPEPAKTVVQTPNTKVEYVEPVSTVPKPPVPATPKAVVRPAVKVTANGPKVAGESEPPKTEAEKHGQHFKPKGASTG